MDRGWVARAGAVKVASAATPGGMNIVLMCRNVVVKNFLFSNIWDGRRPADIARWGSEISYTASASGEHLVVGTLSWLTATSCGKVIRARIRASIPRKRSLADVSYSTTS
jgi:hypothetical protein